MGGVLLPRRKELETVCDELIINPVPCSLSPCAPVGGNREFGNEVESGKKGRVEGRCFYDLGFFLMILLGFDW